MGTIIDYIECPRCQTGDCISDFNYKTGEEFTFCNSCGYSKSIYIINRDKLIKDLTEDDWKVEEIMEPYDCYRMSYNLDKYELQAIETIEEYNYFLNNIFKNIHKIKDLTISRYDGNGILKMEFKDVLRIHKIKKLIYGKGFNENIKEDSLLAST